jgi:hypothetical protein
MWFTGINYYKLAVYDVTINYDHMEMVFIILTVCRRINIDGNCVLFSHLWFSII